MSAKSGKRPLRSLTAHEKLDAIRRVHDGESKASVARDIGVPESTLRGWCKNEDKISYLSRQSTPETDDGQEPKEKRSRVDDVAAVAPQPQPFNLSVKNNGACSPPELLLDPKKVAAEPQQQQTTPKGSAASAAAMTERERNRAELARLSIELGLNRPEMFVPGLNLHGTGLSAANINLVNQWTNTLTATAAAAATPKKQSAPAYEPPAAVAPQTPVANVKSAASSAAAAAAAADKDHQKTDLKNQSSLDDSVWYWLQTQQAMLGLVQNSASADPNSSWFWKWYKQFAYAQQQQQQQQTQQQQNAQQLTTPTSHHHQQQQQQQQQQQTGEKQILYQQLTKDKDAQNTENLKTTPDGSPSLTNNNNNNNNINNNSLSNKNTTKARAVLDNLLLNNNNNVMNKKDDSKCGGGGGGGDGLSQSEALEHGEKFLKWLEHCSEPSVTAMQILQFRYLLSNIKNGADRKNGEHKTKVRRK